MLFSININKQNIFGPCICGCGKINNILWSLLCYIINWFKGYPSHLNGGWVCLVWGINKRISLLSIQIFLNSISKRASSFSTNITATDNSNSIDCFSKNVFSYFKHIRFVGLTTETKENVMTKKKRWTIFKKFFSE